MRGGRVTRWSLQLASVGELLRAERLVVKHVQLNLAAGWLTTTFPESPTLVVVRHPCAVVQSMLAVEWTEDSMRCSTGARPTRRPA